MDINLLHILDNPNAYGTPAGDSFGYCVAISSLYCAVTAYDEDDASGTGSGKVYVFRLSDGELLYTFDNPNYWGTSTNDRFGYGLGISDDYCVVSAYLEDVSNSDTGRLYIYDLSDGSMHSSILNPNTYDLPYGDWFGYAVAVFGDYCAVGVPGEDVGGVSSGTAYIFKISTSELVYTLNNPNAYGTAAGDSFGLSISMSEDYIIVGATVEDDSGGEASGKAYIYRLSDGELIHTIDNPNTYGTSTYDTFSRAVAVYGDYCVITAEQEDEAGGTQSGKAYIYNVSSGALLHTIDNPNADGVFDKDRFGICAAISDDYCAVGSRQEGGSSGKIYLFSVESGELVATIDDPNAYGTSTADLFGYSVAIFGNKIIVGAYGEDEEVGASSGNAYIFAIDEVIAESIRQMQAYVNIGGVIKQVTVYANVGGGIEELIAYGNIT